MGEASLPPAPGRVAKPTAAPKSRAIDVSWAAPTGTATSYQVQYRPCQVTGPASSQCRWRTCARLDSGNNYCEVLRPN